MKRRITLWSVCTVMAWALSLVMPTTAALADAPKLKHEKVLDGLENPWDMAFLDDGTMFFTEKCKGLSVRLPSGDVKPSWIPARATIFSVKAKLACRA